MAVLNHGQLETLWESVGGPGFVADTAAAIAQAESGGRTDAILNTAYPKRANYHPPAAGNLPEFSVGLWQINIFVHTQYTQAKMLTQRGNAAAALAISNHGTDFSPWSTYTTTDPKRSYKRFLVGVPPPPPGTTGVPAAPGSPTAPLVHRGYADLRNSLNRHLPTQLERSRRTGLVTLRNLSRLSRVRH